MLNREDEKTMKNANMIGYFNILRRPILQCIVTSARCVTTPDFATIWFVFSAATNLSAENTLWGRENDDARRARHGQELKYRTYRDRRRRRLANQRTGK